MQKSSRFNGVTKKRPDSTESRLTLSRYSRMKELKHRLEGRANKRLHHGFSRGEVEPEVFFLPTNSIIYFYT
jgi:hypothetical protein